MVHGCSRFTTASGAVPACTVLPWPRRPRESAGSRPEQAGTGRPGRLASAGPGAGSELVFLPCFQLRPLAGQFPLPSSDARGSGGWEASL